jgi:hypothetical protein
MSFYEMGIRQRRKCLSSASAAWVVANIHAAGSGCVMRAKNVDTPKFNQPAGAAG